MVDVDPRTLNVDPDAVRAALGPRTRGVVFIDYGGSAADHAALESLTRAHGAFLLHDAAHSIGTAADGRRPGAWGVGATLSFHVAKVLTSVEGGMLVTNDTCLAESARTLRNQGEPAGAKYVFTMVGHNYRMSDLHAAVGLAQLAKLEALLADRARVAGWYEAALRDVEEVTLPAVRPGTVHGRFLFSILLRDRALRDRVEVALGRAGIETRICWPLPVYRQRAYAERVRPLPCPVAEDVAGRVLSLPFGATLGADDAALVVRTLREAVGSAR
jgi:perosamine synthetase